MVTFLNASLRALALLSVLAALALPAWSQTYTGQIHVIDGDTIDLHGTRIRLHGIDAPEGDQPCLDARGERFRCGDWVTAQVAARYNGEPALCTQRDIDGYGRVVATCSVKMRGKAEDIGEWIVSEGLAFAYRKYSMAYDLTEKGAAVTGRGLWSMTVQEPAAYRAEQRSATATRPARTDSCVIKGNISGNGRIYHMPGQEHYDRTRISVAHGERWFCSEAEARAAGWRRARKKELKVFRLPPCPLDPCQSPTPARLASLYNERDKGR